MNPIEEYKLMLSRRSFLGRFGLGVGTAALASLLNDDGFSAALQHFAPKAKRVIYLFQSGGPSQMDLFDHKPKLDNLRGQNLPESIRMGQRFTGMTAYQSSFPDCAFDLQVRAARTVGRMVERVVAAHGQDRR